MGGTENAANVSSVGSNVGTAVDTSSAMSAFNAGSSAAPYVSTYGQMADIGGNAGSSIGPTMTNAMNTYGSVDQPSMLDQMVGYYDRFQNGMNQTLPEAYKNFGNNPETWGYGLGKVSGMMKGGGSAPQAPVQPININYQQPENSYLQRYKKRYLYG